MWMILHFSVLMEDLSHSALMQCLLGFEKLEPKTLRQRGFIAEIELLRASLMWHFSIMQYVSMLTLTWSKKLKNMQDRRNTCALFTLGRHEFRI